MLLSFRSHASADQDEENTGLIVKLKDAEDEKHRASRTATAQQSQIEKYKKLLDDSKNRADSLELQINGLKKVGAFKCFFNRCMIKDLKCYGGPLLLGPILLEHPKKMCLCQWQLVPWCGD